MFAAVSLAVLTLLLAGPAPRVMSRVTVFRRTPGPALLAWQSVSIAAVVSALLIAPAALIGAADPALSWAGALTDRPALVLPALVVTLVMAGSLLVSGHRVGRRLRLVRRRHRDLVDLLDPPGRRTEIEQAETDPQALRELSVRVLEHPGVSVYCLPGLRQRVVVSRGAARRLDASELEAVMAHERAHLRARHDLILEFFTVLHHAVPAPLRSRAAMAEVHLLAEALADRAAVRRTGPVPVARALVALGGASSPDAAMGAGDTAGRITVRLRLIAESDRRNPGLVLAALGLSVLVLAAPWLLLTLA